jgi:hypothetical protein
MFQAFAQLSTIIEEDESCESSTSTIIQEDEKEHDAYSSE